MKVNFSNGYLYLLCINSYCFISTVTIFMKTSIKRTSQASIATFVGGGNLFLCCFYYTSKTILSSILLKCQYVAVMIRNGGKRKKKKKKTEQGL